MQLDNLGLEVGHTRMTVDSTLVLERSFCRTSFKMSPNPAGKQLSIEANYPIKDIYCISIVTGASVLQTANMDVKQVSLDVSNVPAGIYIVKVVFDDGNFELRELSLIH